MRKLRWWQWGLAGVVGMSIIGILVDPPEAQKLEKHEQQLTPIASPEVREPRKDGHFVLIVDRRQDPKTLPTLARELCGPKSFCIVSGWTNRDSAARGYPYTDREAASIAFSYLLNRSTGSETILWDCTIWPSIDKASCAAR